MSLDEALTQAREAVLEWRDVRGMSRPSDLGRGEPARVVRAEVRVAFERRTLDAEIEPAPEDAVDAGATPPDPWSLELPAPRDGTEWSQRVVLRDRARIEACRICNGARGFKCDDCGGRGYKTETTYDPITGIRRTIQFVCGTCAGAKAVRCNSCRGSTRVRVVPVVVAETGAEVRRDVIHDGSLPDELAREIRAAPSARFWNEKRLHAAEGDDPELGPWGGAQPTSLAATAAAAIDALWSAPHGDGRRARAWRVEVMEGHVVRFKLRDRELWVWGTPPRVAGDDDPVSGRVPRGLVLAGLGAVAALAAIAWWWLG